MKKFIILLGMLLLTGNALLAQKLIIGVKAPDLKIKEWITERSLTNGRPTLIEFFFSRSQPSCSRLAVMDTLVFAVGLDTDNKTFSAYGAEFVPFGVLLDDKNRVLWFGNSSKFGEKELQNTLLKR